MAALPRFPVTLPLRGLALVALCALYLLAGLTGHDPWKNDDATHFGIAYDLLNGGDWWAPRLVGEAYLDAPPLYYWVAAACGRLFGWLLPLHDAVRLATGLFGALFLAFLGYASRTLHSLASVASTDPEFASPKLTRVSAERQVGGAAILIAIGSLGLLWPIHETQPLIALLAASAAAYAGFALLPRRPLAGGVLAGLGIGLGFLAGGLTALVTLAPLLLLLPLSHHWRSAASLRGLAIAVAIAAPLCASWPLLLAWLTPDTLSAWWSNAANPIHYQKAWLHALPVYAELLAYFTWPALPLAAWTVWFHRRQLGQPALLLPLVGSLTTLLALLLFYEPQRNQALPLLVPLILLAAGGTSRLQRGAANAFDWFGMMTFTIAAVVIWIYGLAITGGVPARLAHHLAELVPGFVARLSPLAYVAAAILSLAWLWLIFASPRSPWRAATHWATGTTLIWVLLMTLWLPWIDYGMSYRGVAASLQSTLQAISKTHRCIAGRDLGNTQRVSLQYFAGIVTQPAETPAASACPLLLEQGSTHDKMAHHGWRKIWEGHRPGDRSERLRLYQREEQ